MYFLGILIMQKSKQLEILKSRNHVLIKHNDYLYENAIYDLNMDTYGEEFFEEVEKELIIEINGLIKKLKK